MADATQGGLFDDQSDGTPVPPLRLRRLTLVGVGPSGARFDPLVLDLSDGGTAASRVLLSLTNTGGKSTLISLLTNLVLPAASDQIGGRQIGDFLLDYNVGHVVAEWDQSEGPAFVTGVVMEWRDGGAQPPHHNRAASGMHRRWYTFRAGAGIEVDDLTFFTDGRRVPQERFTASLRELIAGHPVAQGAIASTQTEWAEVLRDNTALDPVLFRYQMRMNDSESGAEALLKNFDTPDNVVRFLVDAFSDENETAEFMKKLDSYAKVAAERPHLEALLEFSDTVRPLVDNVTNTAAALVEAAAEQAKIETRGLELRASLRARVTQGETQIGELAGDIAQVSASAEQQRTTSGRVPDIRAQLRLLAAQHDVEVTDAAFEDAKKRRVAAEAEAKAWSAVGDLLRRDDSRVAYDTAKKIWDSKNADSEPLRFELDAAGVAYASRLAAVIVEAELGAEAAAGEATAYELLAGQHQEAVGAARETLARLDSEAQELNGRVEAAVSERGAAQAAGKIDVDEPAEDAIGRWTTARDEAIDDVNTAKAAIEAATATKEQTRARQRAAGTELNELRAAAQLSAGRLDGFDAEFAEHATNGGLVELLGGQADSIDDLARGRRLSTESAQRADDRQTEARNTYSAAVAELDYLSRAGTAATSDDVIAVQLHLLNSSIGAVTGLSWIDSNINADDREAFIAARPALAGGVVVTDPARFEHAVAALDSLPTPPRSPVTVTAATSSGTKADPATHVVIPHRSTWDSQWAERTVAELEATRDRSETEANTARDDAERHRGLGAALGSFLERWTGHTRTSLHATADSDATAVAGALERLGLLDEKLEELDTEIGTAQGAREAAKLRQQECSNTIETLGRIRHLDAVSATATARLRQLPDEREQLRTQRSADANAEISARDAAQHAREQVTNRQRDAEAWMKLRPEVAMYDPGADPGGNLDTLRSSWNQLRRRLEEVTTGSDEHQDLINAEARLEEDEARLTKYDTAAVQRATQLATTLDAANTVSLRRAVDRSAHLRDEAVGVANDATFARDQALSVLESIQPDGRSIHFDLTNTPEWQPGTPEQIPELLAELDRYQDRIREELRVTEGELAEFTRLRDAIDADNTSMTESAGMWGSHGDDPAHVDPFDATKEAARQLVLDLIEARLDAGTEVAAATEQRTEALRVVRAAASRSSWPDLEHQLAIRLRELDDAALVDESEHLSAEAKFSVSCAGELATLNENRTMLRDELVQLCRTQRQLLKSVTTASRLPDGLGEVSGQPALKIGFEVANSTDAAAALATRIDAWAIDVSSKRKSTGPQQRVKFLADAVSDTVVNRPRAGRYTVEVLKPQLDNRVTYCPAGRIPREFSGGQELTLAVLVFCALSKVRSQNRPGGSRPPGALILDNPFGRASAAPLIAMQHRLAAHSGVQLICATGIGDPVIEDSFSTAGSVIVRLRNDGDVRRNLQYLRVRSVTASGIETNLLAGRDPDDPDNYVTALPYRVRR